MRPISLAFLLALAAVPAAPDAVDDYVRAQMGRQKIPGLSLAVCRNGRVAKALGYGFANVELQAPARAETVYQSGSVGKQFTATAVMMLAQEGHLSLDDPIGKYFEGAPETWARISVRHLLTHTSGIKDWEGQNDIDYRRDYSEDELTRVAFTLPLDFAPGTQWSYSNTGYALLGFIVRKASGQFYGDFLRERVFTPLGMSSTRVISEADIVPQRAAGYRLVEGELTNQEWVSPTLNTTADGSLYLTVLDLAKWDAALYEDKLLEAGGLAQMWTPVRLANGATFPYGFGWGLDEQRGQRLFEHGGSWQGFRTVIARYVERKLSVIVLSNLAQAEPERIAHGIAGMLDPLLALPDPRQAQPDPDSRRTAALRSVLAAWAKGELGPGMAPGLRGANAGTAREKAARKRVGQHLEKATAFTFLAEDDVHQSGLERRGTTVARIVHCGLLTPDAAYAYRFHLGASGEVADFDWEER